MKNSKIVIKTDLPPDGKGQLNNQVPSMKNPPPPPPKVQNTPQNSNNENK